jgi:hypothetical protein
VGHPGVVAALDYAEFVWVSRPGTRHCANLAARSAVGIVVFDSTVAVGSAAAVYIEAEAEEVGPDDRAAALAVFNGRAQAQGIGSWSEHDVSGAAQFRIYRARASRVYVLDEHDGRVEVGSRQAVHSAIAAARKACPVAQEAQMG